MKNWFNGLPGEGISITANDGGTLTYWFDGLPSEYIFTGGGATTGGITGWKTLLGVGM